MDSYHVQALLSKRLYGHVKHGIENYRPLDVKLSVRLQEIHGHCLIQTIKTVGENPGKSLFLEPSNLMFSGHLQNLLFYLQILVQH